MPLTAAKPISSQEFDPGLDGESALPFTVIQRTAGVPLLCDGLTCWIVGNDVLIGHQQCRLICLWNADTVRAHDPEQRRSAVLGKLFG